MVPLSTRNTDFNCWRNISCAHETGNVLDHCAVWAYKDNNIVGHLPTESIQGEFPGFLTKLSSGGVAPPFAWLAPLLQL